MQFFIYYLLFTFTFINADITFSTKQISPTTQHIQLSFEVPEDDYIYKDYLDIAVDSPHITLSSPQYFPEAQPCYDTVFKETKKLFTKSFTITVQATNKQLEEHPAYLHVTYFQHSKKKHITELFTLFNTHEPAISPHEPHISIDSASSQVQVQQQPQVDEFTLAINAICIEFITKTGPIIILFSLFLLCFIFATNFMRLFLLLCFGALYLLYRFLPLYYSLFFASVCALCLGIYVLIFPRKKERRHWYMSALGILFISGSIIGFVKVYSTLYQAKILLYQH